jgi:hypothetical protein
MKLLWFHSSLIDDEELFTFGDIGTKNVIENLISQL